MNGGFGSMGTFFLLFFGFNHAKALAKVPLDGETPVQVLAGGGLSLPLRSTRSMAK